MSTDPYDSLERAVAAYVEWPDEDATVDAVDAARQFVRAVRMRAEQVEYQRATVTPTQEALAALMKDIVGE